MAPPPNDDIQNATVLDPAGGTLAGTLVDSTMQDAAEAAWFAVGGRSVWYTITFDTPSVLTIETVSGGGFTPWTEVRVPNGPTPTSFNDVNDPIAFMGDGSVTVKETLVLDKGVTFYIVQSNYEFDSSQGTFQMTWTVKPQPLQFYTMQGGDFGSGGMNDTSLYMVNPNAYPSALVNLGTTRAPIGYVDPTFPGTDPCNRAIVALAFDPTGGILYGITWDNGNPALFELYTIDVDTGVGTAVSGFGYPAFLTFDMACRSDGVMFAWIHFPSGPAGTDLATINLATGLATRIGVAGGGTTADKAGIAFDSADILWGCLDGAAGNLVTLDQAGGGVLTSVGLSGAPEPTGYITALAFDKNDQLWGVNFGSMAYLVKINTATGVITNVGQDNPVGSNLNYFVSLAYRTGDLNVVTDPPTNVTPTTATLNGTVNPEGVSSSVHFEYGLTDSYGDSTATQNIGSGSSPVAVSESVSGLRPGRAYHVRVVRTP